MLILLLGEGIWNERLRKYEYFFDIEVSQSKQWPFLSYMYTLDLLAKTDNYDVCTPVDTIEVNLA